MRRLRSKLADPEAERTCRIRTVRGVGFRLEPAGASPTRRPSGTITTAQAHHPRRVLRRHLSPARGLTAPDGAASERPVTRRAGAVASGPVPDVTGPPPDEVAEAVDHLRGHPPAVHLRRTRSPGATGTRSRRQFLPDCVVDLDLVSRLAQELVGPDAMAEFVSEAIERFEFFEFVVLNHHVDLWPGGDRAAATGRVFMCELRQLHGETGAPTPSGATTTRTPRSTGGGCSPAAATARWPAGPRASCSR